MVSQIHREECRSRGAGEHVGYLHHFAFLGMGGRDEELEKAAGFFLGMEGRSLEGVFLTSPGAFGSPSLGGAGSISLLAFLDGGDGSASSDENFLFFSFFALGAPEVLVSISASSLLSRLLSCSAAFPTGSPSASVTSSLDPACFLSCCFLLLGSLMLNFFVFTSFTSSCSTFLFFFSFLASLFLSFLLFFSCLSFFSALLFC
mmetsp:Transcript_28977/g.93352  ORF Transcript_28977/g.93352 Transcript_28977/m.93352 type:complete len:203 (-) Transcript_28977:1936-2544(-)